MAAERSAISSGLPPRLASSIAERPDGSVAFGSTPRPARKSNAAVYRGVDGAGQARARMRAGQT